MNNKLGAISSIAGIAGTILSFYLFFKPTPEPSTPLAAIPPVVQPSFDCPKATNRAERLICNTQEIAILDLSLANAYRELQAEKVSKNEKNELKSKQVYWLNNVRNKCVDVQCLKEVYETRINFFNNSRR